MFLNAEKLSVVPHTIITGIENDKIKRKFIDSDPENLMMLT